MRQLGTMPPRRCREQLATNATMGEEMRKICVRIDAIDTVQRRAPNAYDISEAMSEEMEA